MSTGSAAIPLLKAAPEAAQVADRLAGGDWHGMELCLAPRHVATPDLQVRGRRWAWIEYDGSYHDAEAQHEADVRRENRLAVVE